MTPRALCFRLKGYLETAMKRGPLHRELVPIADMLSEVDMPPPEACEADSLADDEDEP